MQTWMIIMGSLFMMGKFDLDSEAGVQYLRIGFIGATCYCSFAFMWMTRVVEAKKDQTVIVSAPATEEKEEVKITKHEYDMQKLQESMQTFIITMIFMGVLHFVAGANKPLLLQSLMLPFNLIEGPLWKVHMLGLSDEEGDLKRPWHNLNPLGFAPAPARPPQPTEASPGAAQPSAVEGADQSASKPSGTEASGPAKASG